MFGRKMVYGAIAAVALSYGTAQAATIQITDPYNTAASALAGLAQGTLQVPGDIYALRPDTSEMAGASFLNIYKFDVVPPVVAGTKLDVHFAPAVPVGIGSLTLKWFSDIIAPVQIGGTVNITDGAGNLIFPLTLGTIVSQVLATSPVYLEITGTRLGPGTAGRYDFDVTASAVPVPGAVFLFGTVLAGGVGGLQLMRRRRTAAARAA